MANQQVMKAWVEALRSGEYDQTQGALRRNKETPGIPAGWCCLGVLCDIAVKHPELGDGPLPEYTWIDNDPDDVFQRLVWDQAGVTRSEGAMPPQAVTAWSGVNDWSVAKDLVPDAPGEENIDGRVALAYLNDSHGSTLAEIADLLEKEYLNA